MILLQPTLLLNGSHVHVPQEQVTSVEVVKNRTDVIGPAAPGAPT